MNSMHINTARKIMDRAEFSIRFLTEKAEFRYIERAVSLKYNFRNGTRTIKAIPSGQIRRIRDALIYQLNDIEVFI